MFSRIVLFVAVAAMAVFAAPASNVVKRNVFSGGKATWYSAGVSEGNCGWWSTNADHIVALNTHQYGSTDKVSDSCGKLIRIVNESNGKVMHAVVADSCPTCKPYDLDLSKGLFAELTDGNLDLGVFPISWSYLT